MMRRPGSSPSTPSTQPTIQLTHRLTDRKQQMVAPDPAHYSILVLSHTLKANLGGQQLVKLMDSMCGLRLGRVLVLLLSSCRRICCLPLAQPEHAI